MKIAYFGSPTISQWLLEYLRSQNVDIALIVTQPDMPAGKRLQLTPTAIKKYAMDNQITLFDKPLSPSNETELIKTLQEKQIELGILFAYGEILSTNVLHSMKYGIWNVHPSLLPKYRGPAPIIYPLLLGESITGTTLIQMNEELDQGAILQQDSLSISHQDIRSTIEPKLIDLAGKQIINALSLLKTHLLQSKQQESQLATYTKILKKKDGYISQEFLSKALANKKISFEELPQLLQHYYKRNNIPHENEYDAGPILFNLYQGLYPWPGIWTAIIVNGSEKRLKVLKITISNNTPVIETVQLEGKKPVNFQTFSKAYNYKL